MLIGEKTLLKKNQVSYIHVSHYQELSVKNLWTDLKSDAAFKVYFQDEYPNNRLPSREYFFNILNTIYPVYLANIMEHASKERFAADGVKQKEKAIHATDEWYEEL